MTTLSASTKSAHGRLKIDEVTQVFGQVTALDRVSLEIEQGEFLTLLGPSGCGKTTLLNILSGFAQPKSGRILLDSRDLTRVPAHKRPMNMVFQRATLFPHLDVFENVAFGLRISRVPEGEIRTRVADALELVRLGGFARRRSHELSGGQTQRVALARALINRPRVLLLDEPLSALDLRIRLEMESELRRLHRETGATFVYVTHDQREALALSDRIAVFNHGHLEQLGTPDEIYHRPATPFAARFVGDSNVLPVQVLSVDAGTARVEVCSSRYEVDAGTVTSTGPAWLVVRPETARLGSPEGSEGCQGVVVDIAFRGTGHTYEVSLPGIEKIVKVEMPSTSDEPFAIGAGVSVTWDRRSVRLLPRPGSEVEP
jgi:ABC-type Fe3+/spermidine/putrescine transport system ATPase subunit